MRGRIFVGGDPRDKPEDDGVGEEDPRDKPEDDG